MGLPEIEVAKMADSLNIFKRIGVYGKSYIYYNGSGEDSLVSVKGYNNKVGFIHLGIADKIVSNKVLPGTWGDWVN